MLFTFKRSKKESFLVEEAESHVVVLLLGLFLLLLFLLLGGRSGGAAAGSGGGGSGTARAHAGADGGDEGLDVAAGQGLGEKAGPEGLHGHLSGLQDGGDLLTGDVDLVVGENECGVDAGQLGGVAHLDLVWDGRASRRFRTLAQKFENKH